MRSNYKVGKMHPQRKAILDSIGFNWVRKDAESIRDQQLHSRPAAVKLSSKVHSRPAAVKLKRGGDVAGVHSDAQASEPSGSDLQAGAAAAGAGARSLMGDNGVKNKELRLLLGPNERRKTLSSVGMEDRLKALLGPIERRRASSSVGAGDEVRAQSQGEARTSTAAQSSGGRGGGDGARGQQSGREGSSGSRGAKGGVGQCLGGPDGGEEEALVPDKLLTFRQGKPAQVAPFVRICFMWAKREWYFGTVKSETSTKGWWNVEWDDKTKNQLLLSKKTVWFILKDHADERHVRGLQRLQEKEQEALDRKRSADGAGGSLPTHAGARGDGGCSGEKRKEMSRWEKGWETRKRLHAAVHAGPGVGQRSVEATSNNPVVQGSHRVSGIQKPRRLAQGTLAVLQGITSKRHYNGLHVMVQGYLVDGDKYNVRVLHPNEDNDVKSNVIVKGDNLRLQNLQESTLVSRDSRAAIRAAAAIKQMEEEEREERRRLERGNELDMEVEQDE